MRKSVQLRKAGKLEVSSESVTDSGRKASLGRVGRFSRYKIVHEPRVLPALSLFPSSLLAN